MKKNLRPDEVAELLNVSRRQAYRLITAGHFTVFRLGGPGSALRVTRESVESYVQRQISLFELENGIRSVD